MIANWPVIVADANLANVELLCSIATGGASNVDLEQGKSLPRGGLPSVKILAIVERKLVKRDCRFPLRVYIGIRQRVISVHGSSKKSSSSQLPFDFYDTYKRVRLKSSWYVVAYWQLAHQVIRTLKLVANDKNATCMLYHMVPHIILNVFILWKDISAQYGSHHLQWLLHFLPILKIFFDCHFLLSSWTPIHPDRWHYTSYKQRQDRQQNVLSEIPCHD